MKKISLLCSIVLVTLSLCGCSNGHHYNLKKLRAEHSRLLKLSKKKNHKRNKKHSTKVKTSTKQNTSRKKSSSSKQNNVANHKNQQTNNKPTAQNANSIPPEYQKNIDKGLEWDGTRRRDSFKSDADFQRYNAWHQGYNYDPNTNTYTQMNQQQLDNMRQQMNKDGGKNFQ